MTILEEGVDDAEDGRPADLRNRPKVRVAAIVSPHALRTLAHALIRGRFPITSRGLRQMQIGVTDDTMTIALAVLRELLWDQECALVFLPGLQEITAMMDLLSDPSVRNQSMERSRA